MTAAFQRQFELERDDYLAQLDFYTWTRHYHLLKDLAASERGDVLEVGTGDGVLRRCAAPFVRSYTVLDINPRLAPDIVADLREPQPALHGRYDATVAAEVLEHLPFEVFGRCLDTLAATLRLGGRLYLTLPHRKSHWLVVTPRQRLVALRVPVGLTSLAEAYHRFVRRRIWIDPHHCWEIGDGRIRRRDIAAALAKAGLGVERFVELPYCDYWVCVRT